MNNDKLIKINTGLEKVSKQIAVTNKLLQAIEKAKDGIEMVFVQGGTFQMGDTNSKYDEPVYSVTVNDFYIGRYQITQAQWKEVMGSNPSSHKDCDNCPIENVSWYDAQEFIQKLNTKTGKNYRLPTEAEWEYAAKGGSQANSLLLFSYEYAGSNDINAVAWYDGTIGNTHPVGEKQPNELDIYDMSGNVYEWCSDWLDATQECRVIRGGSWRDGPGHSRVVFRNGSIPDNHYSRDTGFRLVSSL
jgi:formylglycine-generating enzyme required for sulfatase activity